MRGSEGSNVQGVVFLFNLNIINISKYGKIRLISSFLVTNIKNKFKASETKLKNTSDRQQGIQETKEPWKLVEGKKKENLKEFLSNHKELLKICPITKFCKD